MPPNLACVQTINTKALTANPPIKASVKTLKTNMFKRSSQILYKGRSFDIHCRTSKSMALNPPAILANTICPSRFRCFLQLPQRPGIGFHICSSASQSDLTWAHSEMPKSFWSTNLCRWLNFQDGFQPRCCLLGEDHLWLQR
eukprot:c21571_g1_i1 orf=925-1350(-)